MKIIFMGTGTSQGVPVIASENKTLDLSNPKNWRTRTSAHLEICGRHIQIDAAPEFRLQCIKNDIRKLDMFILTHGHADHIAGMDDLRRFCDLSPLKTVDVYSSDEGLGRIKSMFPYALKGAPMQPGYPCFNLFKMPGEFQPWDEVKIYSEPLPHGPMNTLGLIFEGEGKKVAYFSDCKSISERALKLSKGADILVIDALKFKPHPSHLSLSEALKYSAEINARRTFLTHTTSAIDYGVVSPTLPKNCEIAYDGLVVEL